jgi:imidazolonepropionase
MVHEGVPLVVIQRQLGDMRMTPEEALLAATRGGARALRRDDVGRLAPGSCADAVVLDAPSYTHLVYRPGVSLVGAVVMAGEVVLLELGDPPG